MDGQDDLSFKGEWPAFDDFAARLAAAGGAWVRDTEYETRRAGILGRPLPGVQFTHYDPHRVADALLRLGPRSGGEWDVSVVPIVPADPRFGPDDWNRLVAEFAAHAAPYARAAGLEVVGPWRRPINLREHTTYTTAVAAERFRTAADPARLTAEDHARWRAFVIRAYRDDRAPADDVIRKWLSQHGWASAQIDPLLEEYDGAFRLLTEYEEAARV